MSQYPKPPAMQIIAPHRICHVLGHKRTGYKPFPHDHDRRRRNRWYMRCDRCGLDSVEVYEEGLLERFGWWRIRATFYGWKRELRQRMWSDCTDWGKPAWRFGRPVGVHDDENHIPF